MADRNLSVRLSVIDGGKVKAELRDVGESGARSLQRIEAASRPASRALLALDGAAGSVRGSMEGFASRLGPLGAALRTLGPAGIAAGAALAGIGAALVKGIHEAAEAEASYRRLEAVLRATGHASGLTGREIAAFAEGMERATLVSSEAVQDAAAVLASFRSVSGETFTRTLALAQDLAAVFGQDLRSATLQLGKALEDPVQGLTALRRVGLLFTDSQRELIASLVETGRTAEAQRVILDALESQVGGAGAAEAGGVTGAANRLSDSWGNLLKAIGRTPEVAGLAEHVLDRLARGVERFAALLGEDPIEVRIVGLTRELIEAQDELGRLEAGGPGTPMLGQRFFIEEQRAAVNDLQRQVDDLIAEARGEAEAFADEQRQAEAGQRAAEAERLAEQLSGQRKEITQAIDQLATDPGERIAKVNRELEETKRRLEALRAPEGTNAAEVDAALGQAEELARRRIAAIERPAREMASRVGAANAEVIEALQQQMVGLTDARQGFVDQALERLSEGATAAQRAEVERLAGALHDEKERREELAEAIGAEDRLREEGLRLIEGLRTPTEIYADSLERLNGLLQAGAIGQDSFNRAAAEAADDLAEAQERALRQSRDWQDGVRRALKDYVDASTDAASAAEQATTQAFATMEDALTSFVATGRIEFTSLADSILADVTRIAVRQAITAPLAGWLDENSDDLLGGIGKVLAGILHGGGVAGQDAVPSRAIEAAALAAAPRYHQGGVAGLAPDEVPAILRRGEAVLTPRQMAALGSGLRDEDSRSRAVSVVMNITTPDVAGFRQAQGQIAADAARAMDRARRNL